MSTYNNTLRDLISFLKSSDGESNSFSMILPSVVSFDTDGISGVVIGNLFDINQDVLPNSYKGLGYAVRKVRHQIQNNLWTTTFEAYPFKNHKGNNDVKDKQDKISDAYQKAGILRIDENGRGILRTTGRFDQEVIKKTVQFLKSKGYNDFAVAALTGGFLQESALIPEKTNGIGAVGIAQWLGDRKTKLLNKSNPYTLDTQLNHVIDELNGSEIYAGNYLKSVSNIKDAIRFAAQYERFKNYEVYNGGGEWGNRIGYTNDILTKIQTGYYDA